MTIVSDKRVLFVRQAAAAGHLIINSYRRDGRVLLHQHVVPIGHSPYGVILGEGIFSNIWAFLKPYLARAGKHTLTAAKDLYQQNKAEIHTAAATTVSDVIKKALEGEKPSM